MNSSRSEDLAAAHLQRARDALALGDMTAAVVWCNLCAETAVAHLAAAQGIDVRNDHFRRASAAKRLFEIGAVPEDFADLLLRLNNERKHAVYDGRSPDLRGRTWDEVLDRLAKLVDLAAEVS